MLFCGLLGLLLSNVVNCILHIENLNYISPTTRFCFIKLVIFSFWCSWYSFTAFALDRDGSCCSFSFIFAWEVGFFLFALNHMNKCKNFRIQVAWLTWKWCILQLIPVFLVGWLHEAAYLFPQTWIEVYQLLSFFIEKC